MNEQITILAWQISKTIDITNIDWEYFFYWRTYNDCLTPSCHLHSRDRLKRRKQQRDKSLLKNGDGRVSDRRKHGQQINGLLDARHGELIVGRKDECSLLVWAIWEVLQMGKNNELKMCILVWVEIDPGSSKVTARGQFHERQIPVFKMPNSGV